MKRSFSNGGVAKGGGGSVAVTLAAFGKHPAQNEHLSSLGGQTTAIGELYRVLYVSGIRSLLRRWDGLEEVKRCPFDHWIAMLHGTGVLVARVVASVDRSGRSDYPFVVVADISGASLSAILGGLLTSFDEFVKRCHSLPSMSVLRAALTNEQGLLAARITAYADTEGSVIPSAWRSRFFAGAGLTENPDSFGRVLYSVGNRWAPYFPGRGGRMPKMDGNGVALRLPGAAGEVAPNLLLWEEFAVSRVHDEVPRMYVAPVSGRWLDLVVGPADGAHFYGLGVNPAGMPVETEIPYSVTAEQTSEAVRLLELWRQGDLLTEGGGPMSSRDPENRGDTVRTPHPISTLTSDAPVAPGLQVTPPPPSRGGFSRWRKVGIGGGAIIAAMVAGLVVSRRPATTNGALNERQKSVTTGVVVTDQVAAPASNVTNSALDELAGKANSAFQLKQFSNAWQLAKTTLSKQPTNGVALELARKLNRPITLNVSDVSLEAGQVAIVEVKVVDPLEQTLVPQVELPAGAAMDRLTWTNSQWVYRSAHGTGRTNKVVWTVGNGITNVVAESLVAILADARTLGDEAFASQRYAVALANYKKLSDTDVAETGVAQRIKDLRTPPAIVAAGPVKVVAGGSATFKVTATDVLNRVVSLKPTVDGSGIERGKLEPTGDGSGWKFSASPSASGTVVVKFVADNGQASSSSIVSIEIAPPRQEATPLDIARANADAAWNRGALDEALKSYREVIRLMPAEETRLAGRRVALLTEPAKLSVSGTTVGSAGTQFLGEVKIQSPAGLPASAQWRLEFDTNQWIKGDFKTSPDGHWSWAAPDGESHEWTFVVRALRDSVVSEWTRVTLRSSAPISSTVATTKGATRFPESDFVWLASATGQSWPGKDGSGVWVGRFEVSQDEFFRVMGINPSASPTSGVLPVNNVSPETAQEFCRKLGEQQKAPLAVGWQYRLPTSKEWYAASGGGEIPLLNLPRSGPLPVTGENGGYTNVQGFINILGNLKELVIGPNGIGAAGFSYEVGKAPPRLLNIAPTVYRPASDLGFRIVIGPPLQ